MRQAFRIFVAVAASGAALPALAQATPPAATSSGGGWLWILLVLVVIGVAAWYFMRRRSVSTHSVGVDHDRVAGSAKQAMGSVKEGAGSLIGDTKLQAEGRADKIEGKVQNTVGGIKDTFRGN
jgi:uncharacterized protein YjbJ (UPF0337 family)